MTPSSGPAAPGPVTVLTDDETLLRDSVRTFAHQTLEPLVREMDRSALIPPTLIRQLFDLGIMAIPVPESHGGGGGTLMHAVLTVEALSAVDPSVGVLVDVQNTLVANALLRWGTSALHSEWLPRLASGTVGAFALSEAGAGSDAFALATRAVGAPDGFRLTGRKLWITNAAEAGVFLVFATVDPAAGYRGVTAFVVDRDVPGLSVGRKEDKLGIRASSTCEVVLDDVFVPLSRVLGSVGHGYRVAIDTLNEGRIGIGAQMVGLASGALAHAIRHTHERRQFGQAIAEFQAVRFQLARAATEVESARLLVYNAARRRDAGLPFVTESAMCKLVASETAERVASLAVNLFGGAGFVADSPVEKLYRDAKIGQIYEGTSNMQLHTIARQILD
jgi:alkylation response protein AidB-like acyl-CoA dehydrogenase